MAAKKGLNSFIPWYRLLPLLNIHCDGNQLPITVECPLCNGHNLSIYQDNILHGTRHYCSDCDSSGGMLELAATAWKLNLQETILRLENNGVNFPADAATAEVLDNYKKTIVDPQTRAHKLKSDSSFTMSRGLDIKVVQNKLGLNTTLSQAVWRERMGKFIGSVDFVRATQTYTPAVTDRRGAKTTAGCIFKGKNWSNVLVVPFQDMPGRICGFLFVGRQAEIEDVIYKPVHATIHNNRYASPTTQNIESGLCMYEVLQMQTSFSHIFRNNIFVTVNPFDALKLQNRHMRDSALPLPVVGSYHGIYRTQKRENKYNVASLNVWDANRHKKFIFWGKRIKAAVFNMASRANGRVCIMPKSADLFWRTSDNLLLTVQHKALPWMLALEESINSLDNVELHDFVSQLNLTAPTQQEFIDTCGAKTREIFLRAKETPTIQKVFVNNREVSANSSGWWDAKTGAHIANARLKITDILYAEMDDVIFYKGVILFNKEELPFCCAAKIIEKNPFMWMRQKLITEKKFVLIYAYAWVRHAIEVAFHFHKPIVHHSVGKFGWNTYESQFYFPKFIINVTGNTVKKDAFIVDELAPAKNVAPPDTLEIADLAALTEQTDVLQLYWAVAGCVISNIIAPALNKPRVNIGLIGEGATLIGRITASIIGCATYVLPQTAYTVDIFDKIQKVASRHSWPLILADRKLTPFCKSPWLGQDATNNLIVNVNDYAADVLKLNGNWRFITNATPLMGASIINNLGSKILPAWLQDLCVRNFAFSDDAGSLVQLVLRDIYNWLDNYNKSDVIINALHLIDDVDKSANTRALRFVELIYRYINDGVIVIEQAGFKCNEKIKITFLDNYLFIPKDIIIKLLSKNNAPVLDTSEVTLLLKNTDALEEECFEYNGVVGWLIRRQWWDTNFKHCRVRQNRLLRVVGGDE